MNVTIMLPLLIALAGLLVYALASGAKVVELGRLAFACGLLVTLFEVAGKVIHF